VGEKGGGGVWSEKGSPLARGLEEQGDKLSWLADGP